MVTGYTNPFSPLQLTPDDATRLERLAHAFVRTSMEQYERFAFDQRCHVDDQRWRFVLQRDGVRAYAERRRVPNEDALPDAPVTSTADLPVLLLCGTITGKLDDAMYGSVAPTLDAMRIKTSYIDDELVGSAILATLVTPTPADPFRSLTIKWFEKGRPRHVRAVVKNRDFVYMESTGVSLLSNGERVGYHLMHSVHFPQTPELDTVVRGNMSICGIFRERSDRVVDLYIRGVLNPAGGLMRSIIIKSAASGLASIAQYMRCAERKKLAWLLRRRRAVFKIQRATAALDSFSDVASSWTTLQRTAAAECPFCGKAQSTLSALVSRPRPTCRSCLQQVCSSCKLKKKLSFIAHDHRLVQTNLTFCNACVTDATQLDALEVAADEFAMDAETVTWSEAFADSVSSSSSSSSGSSSRTEAFSPNGSEIGGRGHFEQASE